MAGRSSRASPGGTALALFAFFLYTLLHFNPVAAQFAVNGQIYTNALAIVDAPAPNSPYHAGSNMPIAIDVSGDGKIPQSAQVPGSGLSTSFDSLELYLFSTQAKLNVTVSSGPSFLTQEPGSTVKHLNFEISNCIPAGEYNLTVYEGSHINGTAFFSITSIPVSIQNTAFNGTCAQSNALQSLPQPSSPPPHNPLIDTSTLTPLTVHFDSGASGPSVTFLVLVAPALLLLLA